VLDTITCYHHIIHNAIRKLYSKQIKQAINMMQFYILSRKTRPLEWSQQNKYMWQVSITGTIPNLRSICSTIY